MAVPHTSTLLVIAIFVMAAVLVYWNFRVMRRFERDYRYGGEFQGKRYECILRFANSDSGIRCAVGANASALYLLTAPQRKRPWWGYNGGLGFLRNNLQIPWSDLVWSEKRILLKERVWFEIPSKKIYFYLPPDIGDHLLVHAERKISSEFEIVQSQNTPSHLEQS
jgi:hypothetical protein